MPATFHLPGIWSSMAGPAGLELDDKFFRYHVLPVDRMERANILEDYLKDYLVVSTNSDIVSDSGTEDTRKILPSDGLDMQVFHGIYYPVYIVAPNETIREMKITHLSFGGWDYSIRFPLPGGGEGTMNWRYHEMGLQRPFQTLHGLQEDKPADKPTDSAYITTDDRPVKVWPLEGINAPIKYGVLFLRCGIQVDTDVFQCVMLGSSKNPQ